MSANFRNVALGVILLAVIVTAATSCKKRTVEAPRQEIEPWPIAAIWVGGGGEDAPCQDYFAPDLIVYSDGRIILKKVRRGEKNAMPTVSFWTKIVTFAELAGFQDRMAAVISDPKLESYDWVSGASEGPETTFYFGKRGMGISTRVYGLWLGQLDDPNFLENLSLVDRLGRLPETLFVFCASLRLLDLTGIEPWKPTSLTVEFRPSLEDLTKRPHWPDTWPSADSPTAEPCSELRFVSMDLEKQDLLQQLLGTEMRYELRGIEAGGKKYLVEYHYHFPGEELWRGVWGCDSWDSIVPPPPPHRKLVTPVVPKPVPPKNAFELK